MPKKLPVHFQTTLQCVPNYAILSDYEEDFQGHHIDDVLAESSDRLKEHIDFSVYHQIQASGRNGYVKSADSGSGPAGSEIPAWKLDRFKFLPMVEKAFRHRPSAKWFVFIEMDTYLLWPNLVQYLARFDPGKPYYLGREMAIGDVTFAHGGGGFALSKPAVERLNERWHTHRDEYDQFAIGHWAGDAVLGKALNDADVPLTWMFPNFQSDPLSSIAFDVVEGKLQPWCFATSTYHHMTVENIEALWKFEQHWHRRSNRTLLHADIFKKWIVPQLHARVDDWDNVSEGEEKEGFESFEACRVACEFNRTCRQFSFAAGNCSMSSEIRLGYRTTKRCLEYSFAASYCIKFAQSEGDSESERVHSGWLLNRVQQRMTDMDTQCQEQNEGPWIMHG